MVSALVRRVSEQFVRNAMRLMGNHYEIPLGISVGAALTPEHSADFETLFQYADQTMYKVKQNGKHGFALYEPALGEMELAVELDSELTRISQIVEKRSEANGAMLLGQDSFSWNYRFVMRYIKRYKGEATKIIFFVSAKDGTAVPAESIEEFSTVLQMTLRMSDLIMQNRANQFFLLLPDLSQTDTVQVVERVLREWNKTKASDALAVEYVSSTISYKET